MRRPLCPPRSGRTHRGWRVVSLACVAAWAPLGLGCGAQEQGPYPLEPGRERPAPDRRAPAGAGVRDRLPVRGLDGELLASKPSLAHTLPAGWVEAPPAPPRLLSVRIPGVAGGADGDLSVSRAGGSVADNVNRWRAQLGQEPLAPEAVAALPRQLLLGASAVRVEARGSYRGMGGGEAQPEFALLGLVSEAPGRERWFVKLVGPAALIDAQGAAFDAFTASLSPSSAQTAPSPASAPAPGAPSGRGLDPARLAWDLPEGWKASPSQRTGAIAEFEIAGAPGADCVLSSFGGTTGGVTLNVNRWRGQLGQPELDQAQVDALERIDMLGRKAVLVEIPGRFRGMAGEDVPDALFVGVICLLEEDSLFMKLVGPKPEIEPQREALRALCRSLRMKP